MAQNEISKEEILAVYPKVAETMADALGCDVEEVKLDVSLIEGLDAESIDFLDMVFRLERAFKIKIPRGKIVENARGDLPEAEFEQKGIVTEKGLAQLKSYLSEIPAERFKTPMKVADIPRLFTPETFCKLVISAQREAQAADLTTAPNSARMSDHFAAFSFVDRITEFAPGAHARGWYAVPREIAEFPSCLVAEAVGQLAAWVAMDKLAYRGRPVAALATETLFEGERRARAICWSLTSTSTIATMKSSPTAAGRRSTAGGSSSSGTAWGRCCRSRSSIRRRHCASASRCCAAAARPPGVFRGVAPVPVTVDARVPGQVAATRR